MNSTSTKAVLLSALCLFGIGFALRASAEASAPSATNSRDVRTDEFEAKFRQAMKISARDEMAKLIDRYSWESVLVIMSTCEAISTRSSDSLEEYIEALNGAWKKQYDGSAFVDLEYEYFSLLEPSLKRKRVKLKKLFEETRKQYRENFNGDKNGPRFTLLASEFERLAANFELLGDWYYASESWITYATCFYTGARGRAKADLGKSCTGYKNAIDAREKIELKDKRYRETLPLFKLLEKQGYYKEKPEENATGGTDSAEPAQEDAGAALTVPLSFEFVGDVSAYARPNYHADEVYPAWASLALQGIDSTTKLAGLEESPTFYRVNAADVRPDVAGDGPENDEKIKLTGNLESAHFTIGSGPEKREFAFMTIVGSQTEQFQGIQVNLAPGNEFCTMYVVAAGSMVGDLAGVPIRVIDDNMDGAYGSGPVEWGHTGVTDGMFQSDMDSIVIGTSKRALPWSEYQQVAGQWYRLEALNKGTEIKATPIELVTGTLKLKIKGLKADWMVLRGSGRYENSYFDLLANGSKGVEVPVGYYTLFMGRVSKGKKLQVAKALVLPGAATPGWEVSAGKPTVVELGSPFGFHFTYEADEETISLPGTSVAIAGKAGERYERFWNCVPKPLVSFKKEGSKRGGKPAKMTIIQNAFELTDKGFRAGWFPLDIIINRSKVEGGVSVQLTEKKNKLFGKITSDWK